MDFVYFLIACGGFFWIFNRMNRLQRRIGVVESDLNLAFEEVSRLQEAGHNGQRSAEESSLSGPLQESRNLSDTDAPIKEKSMPQSAEKTAASSIPSAVEEAKKVLHQEAPETPSGAVASEKDDAERSDPSSVRLGWRPSFDFEDIFGRLLPIWGGGIALAVAGFFLVRWSIEVGLLNQYVRVTLGFLFGLGLLGAAEAAYRFENRISDVRVRQALAGAGLATLYASFYFAGAFYGIIGPAVAFAGLAGVTLGAVLLSYRFGLPSAVLGLVGGFAAPALSGSSEPNLPLLATYLALVTGGLTVTGQKQDRPWLGVAALFGALGWGAFMLFATAAGVEIGSSTVLTLGLYLALVGSVLPAMLGAGLLGQVGRIAAGGFAALQIGALVDQSGYSMLAWGCYLLLGAALTVLGARSDRLREAGAFASLLAVILLAIWPEPAATQFLIIAMGATLVFAGAPLAHIMRGKPIKVDWAQLALFPVALILATCVQFEISPIDDIEPLVALGACVLAAIPAIGAWKYWPKGEVDFDLAPFGAMVSSFVLLLLGGILAMPAQWTPVIPAVLSIGAYAVLGGRSDPLPRGLAWGLAIAGAFLLLVTTSWDELSMLVGDSYEGPTLLSLLRFAATAMSFVIVLLDAKSKLGGRAAAIIATLLGYGAAAMIVPPSWMPSLIAAALVGAAWKLVSHRAVPATLAVLGSLWAMVVTLSWISTGIETLGGIPAMVDDLPSLARVARAILPLSLGLGAATVLNPAVFGRMSAAARAAAFGLGFIVLHVAFKQIFAISELEQFAALGLAERSLWQAFLAVSAMGIATAAKDLPILEKPAWLLAGASLLHFGIFSLLLHNPLWDTQAVGAMPIANLLLPSFGIALALLAWCRGQPGALVERARPVIDGVMMALIGVLAVSELRQLFAGSILNSSPVGPTEDLLRSLLAIGLALGFLAWGARSSLRSWRIGSLVFMLGAVVKVFLFDAAGLEGLARIASFLALGLCLIGIGWFYTKQLKQEAGA